MTELNATWTKFARITALWLLAGPLVAFATSHVANAQASTRDALLVTVDALKRHLGDKDLVVLHVGSKSSYSSGHIPGARRLDSEIVAPHGNHKDLMLEMPDWKALHRHLEELGVSDASRIVIYFVDEEFPSATRTALTLDAAGLNNRVSILDGGLRAWKRSGNALTKDVQPLSKGTLSTSTPRQRVVDGAFVQTHLKSPGYKIIDARAPVFYNGIQAGMDTKLKGHLPGAKNIPFTSVVATDLTFKSTSELAAIFKAAGVTEGDRVIAYCHIGYQGTAVVFAARSLGIDAVLYDGSFQDWSRRGLAVENDSDKAP